VTHIIAIGYLGGMRCYLDITEEEAKARYIRDEDEDEDAFDSLSVKRVEVVDGRFGAYEIWETRDG
jgi:hypothetical protein